MVLKFHRCLDSTAAPVPVRKQNDTIMLKITLTSLWDFAGSYEEAIYIVMIRGRDSSIMVILTILTKKSYIHVFRDIETNAE